MVRFSASLMVAAVFVALSGSVASAAGWSGGDSSRLRDHFRQGIVMTKFWDRTNGR